MSARKHYVISASFQTPQSVCGDRIFFVYIFHRHKLARDLLLLDRIEARRIDEQHRHIMFTPMGRLGKVFRPSFFVQSFFLSLYIYIYIYIYGARREYIHIYIYIYIWAHLQQIGRVSRLYPIVISTNVPFQTCGPTMVFQEERHESYRDYDIVVDRDIFMFVIIYIYIYIYIYI